MKTITFYLTLVVVLFGCKQNEQTKDEAVVLTAQESEAALRAILNYLECEECTDGEFEKVVKLGAKATPTLTRVMHEGPAPAKLAEAELAIRESYKNVKDFEKGHKSSSVSASEEEYLSTYIENYKASFQIKAIKALSVIGGEAANSELRKFQQTDIKRGDVKQAIDAAVKSIK